MKKLTLLFCLQFAFIFTLQAQDNQEKIAAQNLQNDAKLLWSALNELHPALYRHNDTTVLEEKYQKLLTNFGEDRTLQETFLLLSEFTAAIKCNHTYINPKNQEGKVENDSSNSSNFIDTLYTQKKLLPFTFKKIENEWFVYKPVSNKLQKGDKIISINGILIDSLIQMISNYIPTDGNTINKKLKDSELTLTSNYEYFDYYFPLLYQLDKEVELEIQSYGKETTQKVSIELLTKDERKELFKERFPFVTDNYDDLWKFKVESNLKDNTKYAYLELGTFQTDKLSYDWKNYLNDIFYQINKQKIQHLIIDIRGNEGGNKKVVNYILDKIAISDWRPVFKKYYVAYNEVGDSLKKHLTSFNKKNFDATRWTKKWNENYRVVKGTPDESKIVYAKLTAYKGKVLLLIDEKVSADAMNLAENCKKTGFATLIGTATGGTKQGFTAERFFILTLPNSNLKVDIPLVGNYPLQKMDDKGIEPDFETHETIKDFMNRKDKALEKAKEIMQQENKLEQEKKINQE